VPLSVLSAFLFAFLISHLPKKLEAIFVRAESGSER
jgi:hypothetical protein